MNIFRYLILFLFSCTLYSCDNITEEIYINEDGSGKYVFYSDMIPGITKMTTEMAMMFQDSLSSDSLEQSLEDNIWKDFPDVIDSMIDYANIIPDSVLSIPGNKELIEKMEFFMEGGKSKGYVNMGFRFEFKDFTELEEMLKKVENNQHSSGAGGGMLPELDEMRTVIEYEMKENVLKRETVFLNKPDLQATDIEMLKLFMTDASMKTIVHLPRKVKDVKGTNMKNFSDKTVTFEYDLLQYIMGNTSSDFEIAMEQ